MTTEYDQLLKTPQWGAKREEILLRDGHRCKNCQSTKGLQVHHRQYHMIKTQEFVKPWEYSNRYLVTLCETCHMAGHQQYTVPVFNLNPISI